MFFGSVQMNVCHMTPRAIFLENHKKKKIPYEGRTRRSDRAGKTRTALLEMHS